MPQSRSTTFSRQKKEESGTNNNKTNFKYETTDAQRKKNVNHHENTPI